MRATTFSTPNVSRATRAEMMLELSPLETAAKACASSMPASMSVSRSKPTPVICRPWKSAPSRRNDPASWSTTATEWPAASRLCAMVDPTRPQPMITTCTPGDVTGRHTTRTLSAVPSLGDLSKRLLVGRPMRSTQLGETLLPKKIALPVFASDALSSVAYATEEILLVLSAGGLALIHLTWYAAAGVAFLMLVVVASYRQNVYAYPSGGGDYEVATTNLGRSAGVTVAAALLVDYVLTVAVSVSSGVANISSAVDSVQGHEVPLAVGIVAVITLLNLRGLRESGTAFAIPTYAFMLGVLALIVFGVTKLGSGEELHASSEQLHYTSSEHFAGLALLFLLLRAFASGCTALTGVEAISNGVPAFKKPKSKNAATTLALLGAIAVSMFLAITAFAILSHVHTAADPADLGLPAGSHPPTVIAQVGAAIFGGYHSFGFYYLQAVTALILVLAANTAFNGFPVLASILARDGFLPRQLHTRGDRLAFSNGILLLAGFAILLIVAF